MLGPMKNSLAVKVFIRLTLGNLLVLGLAVYAFNIGLSRQFDAYLRADAQQRLAAIADDLGAWYETQGNFAALIDNPWLWAQWLGRDIADFSPQFDPKDSRQATPSSLPDALSHRITPLILLDASGRHVAGPPLEAAYMTQTVWAHDTIVGMLVLNTPPPGTLERQVAARFWGQYSVLLLYFSGFLLLAALIFAGWTAHRISGTLRTFGTGVKRLAHRHYEGRLSSSGTQELDDLAYDINTLAQTLSDQQEHQKRWLADIAHELRTPVTILRGELEALQDGLHPPTADRLNSLLDETNRLARLIEDLRQLAQLERGAITLERTRCNMSQLLATGLARHETRWAHHGLKLHAAIAPNVHADIDAGRLLQCLDNFAENSLRYTTAPGEVRVALDQDLTGITWIWEDSAPGVPTADLPHLGEGLFRPDYSRSRATGGSGLGLAITRALARAQGFTLQASASPLGGLRWTLHWPFDETFVPITTTS
jgi:two-component system sensor histidine kinase BaeS